MLVFNTEFAYFKIADPTHTTCVLGSFGMAPKSRERARGDPGVPWRSVGGAGRGLGGPGEPGQPGHVSLLWPSSRTTTVGLQRGTRASISALEINSFYLLILFFVYFSFQNIILETKGKGHVKSFLLAPPRGCNKNNTETLQKFLIDGYLFFFTRESNNNNKWQVFL